MKRLIPSRAGWCAALVGVALVATSAHAMMLRVDPDELAGQSLDVIEGRVIERESRWNDARTHIYTYITIQVDESWAGTSRAGSRVVITTKGGSADGIGQWVEHEPVFGDDESVLLFVESTPDGSLRCVQATQGKYTRAGQYVVGYDLAPRPYAQFREQIRPMVRQRGGEER